MPLNSIGALITGAGNSGAAAREARATEFGNFSSAASSDAAGSTVVRGNADDGPPQFVANYLSPFIRLDSATRLAILQFRDSDTGEVREQYPSPRAIKEYKQNLPERSDLLPSGGSDRQEPVVIGSDSDRAQRAAAESSAAPAVGGTGSGQGRSGGSGVSFGSAAASAAFAAFGAASSAAASGFGSRQLAVA